MSDRSQSFKSCQKAVVVQSVFNQFVGDGLSIAAQVLTREKCPARPSRHKRVVK